MFAVGRVSPSVGVVIVTEQDVDSWRAEIDDAIDGAPDANLEDAYHVGTLDREANAPSRAMEYEPVARMGYIAGYCSPKPSYYDVKLEELRDGIDDETFWRYGS